MLLGELRRWGLAREAVDQLLPARRPGPGVDRALRRPRRRRLRRVPAHDATAGCANQGWKDSLGRHPLRRRRAGPDRRSPCARCRPTSTAPTWPGAHFADETDDAATDGALPRQGAPTCKTAFNRDFWLEDRGLVRDRRSTATSGRSTRSRPTWATACGPASSTRTRRRVVAERLLSPEHVQRLGRPHAGHRRWRATTRSATTTGRSGRTTTPSSPPASCATASSRTPSGSSWPCSTPPAEQADRLPELFAGSAATSSPLPVGYPTSCSPQAWAAASPLLVPAHAAAARPVGALRQGVAVDPVLPRRDRLPAASTASRWPAAPRHRRGRPRRGQGGGAGAGPRAHPESASAFDRLTVAVLTPGAPGAAGPVPQGPSQMGPSPLTRGPLPSGALPDGPPAAPRLLRARAAVGLRSTSARGRVSAV